jgi:predicted DsbA family dithiol-disulfide isomerase
VNASPDSQNGASAARDDPRSVVHWFDFVCPFCYVGQSRTAILERHGLTVTELPFPIHPEIPPSGREAGPRSGTMYTMLDAEARRAGLPLNWPSRLPNTRQALATAEWVRRHAPASSRELSAKLFAAHFVLGEDLGDIAVIDRYAQAAGVDLEALNAARVDGSADRLVTEAQALGEHVGVSGTPAWLIAGRLVVGLRPVEDFERLADAAARLAEQT